MFQKQIVVVIGRIRKQTQDGYFLGKFRILVCLNIGISLFIKLFRLIHLVENLDHVLIFLCPHSQCSGTENHINQYDQQYKTHESTLHRYASFRYL